MILLWGLLEDPTFRSVYDWLRELRANVAFVNHAAVGRTRIGLSSSPKLSYKLCCERHSYRLDTVSAAYLRPYDHRHYDEFAGLGGPQQSASHADIVHQLMHVWAEHADAVIINRPSAEATNHSKLNQARFLRACGFLVPDSIITNDLSEVRYFLSRHGSVIYKSMSSVRSIVKELHACMLDSLGNIGPALFQQRIVGDNLRVHLIGEKVFSCLVRSPSIDYRYGPASLETAHLPDEITARCITLARELGLVVAGIDLIATPEGKYYCLEVNPNPAFSYFELSTDNKIAHAVAQALMLS